MLDQQDFKSIRAGIASIPADISNDAVGQYVAKVNDMYAPETHASALDPSTPIVVGARGTGKSFWASILGQDSTREAADRAYPRLRLSDVRVAFGFTGIAGPGGTSSEHIDDIVPPEAISSIARTFWWATILRAASSAVEQKNDARLRSFVDTAKNIDDRQELLGKFERYLESENVTLLIVYDALDTVAITWTRRRLLTEALLEVVWAMRAYKRIKLKLFLRPDQIDDDALRFVELPKLRTGAVRLTWTGLDLYGLLYARLVLSQDNATRSSFAKLLAGLSIPDADRNAILERNWSPSFDVGEQLRIMQILAGAYMADGQYGYKKGRTYDWPLNHLADALDEVTPRSFLGLMIAAAKHGPIPQSRVVAPEGIRHGLREASKTRVDQLHQDFPWIKGVLAPLAGILLPQEDAIVFKAWRHADTVKQLAADAAANHYLPPFSTNNEQQELQLYEALKHIGVMFRRKDGRIDMPDLYRVAAKLLKKGATTPL